METHTEQEEVRGFAHPAFRTPDLDVYLPEGDTGKKVAAVLEPDKEPTQTPS